LFDVLQLHVCVIILTFFHAILYHNAFSVKKVKLPGHINIMANEAARFFRRSQISSDDDDDDDDDDDL
jgi:hypothetical protein